jgi:hypothetical protein
MVSKGIPRMAFLPPVTPPFLPSPSCSDRAYHDNRRAPYGPQSNLGNRRIRLRREHAVTIDQEPTGFMGAVTQRRRLAVSRRR